MKISSKSKKTEVPVTNNMHRIFILLMCLNMAFSYSSRAQEHQDITLPPAYLIRELANGTDATIQIRIDSIRKEACRDCTSTDLLYAIYYSPVKVLRGKYNLSNTPHRFFTADDASDSAGLYRLPVGGDLIVFLKRLPLATFGVAGEVWFVGLPDSPGAFFYSKQLEKLITQKRGKKK